jgi:PAS domain S-box-containing protein
MTRKSQSISQSHLEAIRGLDQGTGSSELLDLLLSATNDGFIDWDLLAGCARYSLRWKMLLGYEDHELEDGPDLWKQMSHPEDLPRVEEVVRDHLENVWPFSQRWRMRHRNGEWRWMLCRSVIIRDEEGRARRMVSVYTDVTDQVKAEERYRALANGIPDTIFRIRDDGLILDEKPGASPLGLLLEPAVGRTLQEWAIDRTWAGKTLQAVIMAAKTGALAVFEHGDATVGNCVEMRVLKSGDDEAVCIARDITTRKQDEQRLVDSLERLSRTQRELMEASHRAGMAEVASSVLHNVGNVLNSVNISSGAAREILGASRVGSLARVVRMLRDHQADIGPFLTSDPKGKKVIEFLEQLTDALREEGARVRRELDSLQKNVDHIKVIVTMQQTHARSRDGGMAEKLAPSEVLEDALKLIGLWNGAHGYELLREYDPLPEVYTDRHKLLQILTNLVGNARHAMLESSEKKMSVRIIRREARFTVEVQDTGCGITRENLTKIFSHGFTTRKAGHGFGLHSSAIAARELGGTLVAHSEGPGKGALFLLDLPIRRSPPASG